MIAVKHNVQRRLPKLPTPSKRFGTGESAVHRTRTRGSEDGQRDNV